VGLALAATPACAEPMSPSQMLEALKQRDAAIAALEKRIEALERKRGTPATAPVSQASPAPLQAVVAPSVAQGSEDPAEAEALSRALVQRGGLLLPAWRIEAVPSLSYAYSEVQGLTLVDTPEGISTVADQRLRSDSIRGAATVRMGLPWSSQVEMRLPYNWSRQSRALGDGRYVAQSGSGVGDVELSLSHVLAREDGWRPDLIGGISWRAPTGRSPLRVRVPAVATGGGAHALTGRLTAVKAVDPMVFFSTVSYEHSFSQREPFGRFRAGPSIGFELGAVLAVSPETTLSLGLAQDFRGKAGVDGMSLAGTDGVASVFQVGVGRVLSPRVLLDFTLGVGLTREAPDYSLQVSTPVRF
jgi:hypothetical protein